MLDVLRGNHLDKTKWVILDPDSGLHHALRYDALSEGGACRTVQTVCAWSESRGGQAASLRRGDVTCMRCAAGVK